MTSESTIEINFDHGTLLVTADPEQLSPVIDLLKYDQRVKLFRAQGYVYAQLIRQIISAGISFIDHAKILHHFVAPHAAYTRQKR